MDDISALEGIWPVMPTPYQEDGGVDIGAVKKLVNWYSDAGSHGVLVSGSGGEFPYLLPEERTAMIDAAVDVSDDRITIMAGMGSMGGPETCRIARDAIKAGASFVLVALPQYYSVDIDRALDHYRAVAEAAEGRVLYYHYPQTTRFDPGIEAVARICDLEGIVGIKMSRPNIKEMRDLLKHVSNRPFALFSGTVLLLEEAMNIGAAGAIGILPAVFPKESVAWFNALKSGDRKLARSKAKTLYSAIGIMGGFKASAGVLIRGLKTIAKLPFTVTVGESSPHARVKEALRLRGLPIRNDVRGPLSPLTPEDEKKIAKLIQRLEPS